jgi:protein-tyrosine-phosphatase
MTAHLDNKLPISKARSILFLCGMNVIRSPMAEAIARSLLSPNYFLSSAGVEKGEVDPFVSVILAEQGLVAPNHDPTSIDELHDNYFDLIVALTPEAHQRAIEFSKAQAVDIEYWPLPDPSLNTGTREQILEGYRNVRDRLNTKIRERFIG